MAVSECTVKLAEAQSWEAATYLCLAAGQMRLFAFLRKGWYATQYALSMNSESKILAHLWNATRTGEWYCSGQPFGPSPGSSVSLDLVSTGEREEKDMDRWEAGVS